METLISELKNLSEQEKDLILKVLDRNDFILQQEHTRIE